MKLAFFILYFFMFTPLFVQAEICRDKEVQDLVKKTGSKEGKALSLAEYEARKKAAPSIGYVEELQVSACEIQNVKAAILGSDFASLCPGINTPYRLRCLREWIGQRKLTNSTEITMLMALIPPAGIEDKKLSHVNSQMVVAQLIDTVMFTLERMELSNFYVQRMTAEHPEIKAEIKELQILETDLVFKLQSKLVKTLEEKLKILKDQSGREPAGDLNVRRWIKSMIPKMEMRLENLKNKK